MKIDPYLSPCTKLKSRRIKDLNMTPITLNLMEEKLGNTLEHIDTRDHFLNRTPVAQTPRATVNKRDLLKLRSFCKAENMHGQQDKMASYRLGKIFNNPHPHQTEGCSPKYTENSRNCSSKEQIFQ